MALRTPYSYEVCLRQVKVYLHDFAFGVLLQMLKKKLPPLRADVGDQVTHFCQPS